MSLKDDIEKWGSPFKEMVVVTKEREPRTVLVVDSGASEVMLTQSLSLKEIDRGVAVHASFTEDGGKNVLEHCRPYLERENLSTHVAFVWSSRIAMVRMFNGFDMICLNAQSQSFAEDVDAFVPIVHQNGCIWITNIEPTTSPSTMSYIKSLCKLYIDSRHDRFQLHLKKRWTADQTNECEQPESNQRSGIVNETCD